MKHIQKGILVVLSAVSGAGKTTVTNHLLKRDSNFVRSVSVTTRARHPGEKEGLDYFFVSKEEFDDMVRQGSFLEYQEVHSNYYGTPKKFVAEKMNEGKNVVLVIDTKGGLNVKKMFKDTVLIFLLPPSLKELIKRLNIRGRESQEERLKRINNGKEELRDALRYDYIVVNNRVEEAVEDIRAIVRSHFLKSDRNREKVMRIMKEYDI
ncbi:MAG: guanylate kinase [Deltaproteobacteria bacterium]|nr:guanylate kinase [Deltaproteobacteria bacterium]